MDDQHEPDAKELSDLLLRVMRGVNGQAFRMFGSKIVMGPFVGMEIPERTLHWDDGNAATKLLGTYEHELHDKLEYAIWRRPEILLNIGCAEGYYAIGMARLLPELLVCAYDTNAESRALCEDYAQRNGVSERVRVIEGVTSPDTLHHDQRRALYIFDCEGAEGELINLEQCPALARSDLIIECHDFLRPQISSVVADRLERTHRVELIRPRMPDFSRYKFVHQFPTVMSILMVVEKRPMPCCWLTCWANSRGD